MPPRHIAYPLQLPFKEELECLQHQDIIPPLGIGETAEWYIPFVLVPKPNGKVRLCVDPARLNQALIRLVHRRPMLNDIFPKLNNVQHLSLIDASSSYHNLTLDERSSFLTTFACSLGRYRYKRLPYGAVPTGDMFQRKIDEIFKDLPNVFGFADNILVLGYDIDGNGHDDTQQRVLQVCRQVKLKLNEHKCHFRCMQVLFFGKIISRNGMKPDP